MFLGPVKHVVQMRPVKWAAAVRHTEAYWDIAERGSVSDGCSVLRKSVRKEDRAPGASEIHNGYEKCIFSPQRHGMDALVHCRRSQRLLPGESVGGCNLNSQWIWMSAALLVGSSFLTEDVAYGKERVSEIAPTEAAKEEHVAVSGELESDTVLELNAALDHMAKSAGPMAALMTIGDHVVYDRGLRGASPKTVFDTASRSKWLIAATVMSLVDEGRIDLDDPVGRYVGSFDGAKERLTIRQLLSHTSGLPSRVRSLGAVPSLERAVDIIGKNVSLITPPGVRFCYGNLSYQVAVRVVEVVTGQPFQLAFEQRIAKPCGMSNTHFPTGGLGRGVNRAKTTLSDYLKFLKMFRDDGVSEENRRVLSPSAVEEMQRDQTHQSAMGCMNQRALHQWDRKSYGLGLWRDNVDSETGQAAAVSHFGSSGFRAVINYRYNYLMVVGVKSKLKGKRRRLTRHYLRALSIINRLAFLSVGNDRFSP